MRPATRGTYPESMARKLGVAVLVMLASLALVGVASAREVVLRDAEGRTIRFDVRADADVQWYANLLRKAAHGDEIERVTVRIVDWDEIATRCASYAAGCYSRQSGNRGTMVVPAGRSSDIAHTVVHEYGHHVDASRRHGGLDEPNGTPLWWKARGMAFLVGAQSVRDRYQVGWERSISEVFAEDYAYTNLMGRFKISWLERPSETVQQAILADLGLAEPPKISTTRPALKPVVIERQGTLDPNDRVAVTFGLLGPNRRVQLTGTLAGGGRVAVSCGNTFRARQLAAAGPTSLVLPSIGPGQCEASIVNTSSESRPFRFTVRLGLRGGTSAAR
jgi:hypothetical protein